MADNKKFEINKDMLENQLNDLDELIEGDKEALSENAAIARDPNHVLDEQGEWAEARKKGNEEALSRHEQQRAETVRRLKEHN